LLLYSLIERPLLTDVLQGLLYPLSLKPLIPLGYPKCSNRQLKSMKLLFRKACNWFCVLMNPALIDEQEGTCVGFLLERRGILQQPGALQKEMFDLIRQYAMFNGLNDRDAVKQIMRRAGLAQSEIHEAIRSLSAQDLLKVGR
jgi:hypothetical protein